MKRKSIPVLSIFFLIFFFGLGFLVTGILNNQLTTQKQITRSNAAGPIQEPQCVNVGGECQSGKLNEIGKSCALSNGTPGTVAFNLCPSQGNNIRCCVPNSIDPPADSTTPGVNVTVSLQGIGPNANIKNNNRTAVIKIYKNGKIGSTSDYVAQGLLTYDSASGNFTNPDFDLGAIPEGEYRLILQIEKYLDEQLINKSDSKNVFLLAPGAVIEAVKVQMRPGDISPLPKGDNYVNIIDYNAIIGCLPGAPPSACLNRDFADLNDDGQVDQIDLDLLLDNFGEQGFSFQTSEFKCEPDPLCDSGKGSLQLCSLLCTKKTQRG